MTRGELQEHFVTAHGRDYSRSDDGYSDMEAATAEGWRAIAGWGRDGWDLGDWPYVVISVRNRHTGPSVQTGHLFEMRQTVEGDTTVYRFTTTEDRDAAIDYLFVWYGCSRAERLGWIEKFGIGDDCSDARTKLDAGTLRVPEALRGPYSSARTEISEDH